MQSAAQLLNIEGYAPRPPRVDPDVVVYPECRAAVEMFGRLMTQWRTSPAGPIGLDYGALQWFCTLYPVEDVRELVEDVQTMERLWLARFHGG